MGFFQRFKSVLEPDPIRSIEPVSRAQDVATPSGYKYSGDDYATWLQKQRAAFQPAPLPFQGQLSGENMVDWNTYVPRMSEFDTTAAVNSYDKLRGEANPRLTQERLKAIEQIFTNQHGAADALAPKIGYTGDRKTSDPIGYTPEWRNGGESSTPTYAINPDFRDALAQYDYRPTMVGDNPGFDVYDQNGQKISTERTGDGARFLDTLVPMLVAGGAAFFGVPAIGGLLGGGVLGGAAAGAGIGGATAAAQGNDIGKGLLMGGIGGGISGAMGNVPASSGDVASSVASVPADAQSAIDAYLQANPVRMADLMQGIPDLGGSLASVVPSQLESGLQQWAQQTPQQVAALTPDFQVAQPSWLNSVNPEIESSLQQAAQQTPQQLAQTMPDVSSIPRTVPTTGLDPMRQQEIAGYQTDGRLPSSPAVPTGTGGLLGTLKGAGSGALDWMKANPGLAKMLIGGAAGLLGSQGGSSGGAPKQYGPAVQWKSPVAGIPQGLLGGGQQQAQGGGYPAAMGLLGGQANSGAWRFLR